jgi:transcriptional regulator with XRE-family HTH domain
MPRNQQVVKKINQIIGARIKRLRYEHGLTQSDLGQLMHYSESHISRLETGSYQMGIAHIVELSTALDLPFEATLAALFHGNISRQLMALSTGTESYGS